MNDQIKRIYEAMADKTLSFGCRIQSGDTYFVVQSYDETDNNYIHIGKIQYLPDNKKKIGIQINTNLIKMHSVGFEIIGHPVMIGDVWNYAEKNDIKSVLIDGIDGDDCGNLFQSNNKYLISVWQYKRKPIGEQSQECIDFVESLIPKKDLGST